MKLQKLKQTLQGDLFFNDTYRIIYSTDASAYKEKPLAVAYPKNKEDIKKLISFAKENNTSLIARGAGTSLAGQVTGSGIIVDVSKYMNKILKLDAENKKVLVEPGVILTELNIYLRPYGLMFGPETSTANSCTIGGMLGNNACGLHSLRYGSTRDHTLSVSAVLSDGSEVEFNDLEKDDFKVKLSKDTLEGNIYKQIYKILSDDEITSLIEEEYPDKDIPRRNTGYALDLLTGNSVFNNSSKHKFNFSNLLAGSEGTLAFTTEICLNLVDLPPKKKALLCVHFKELEHAFDANLTALKYDPEAVELTDKTILDLTKENKELKEKRFFIKDDPAAVLFIEFTNDSKEEIKKTAKALEKDMLGSGYGYHFPLIWGDDIQKVWELRKAGLGVLSNMPGDARPVSLVEDTVVKPEKLPEYISDFKKILEKYDLECVYHAHIATGELHLRPILNLKDPKDVRLFKKVARDTAHLVKRYKGSLSGEHGDGRLRGEFIPVIYGNKIYNLFKEIKLTWDPNNIFNPGKIIDTPSMDQQLRYEPGQETKKIDTIFDFSSTGGYQRAAEKCNGSGDCIKPVIAGGTMCPSYRGSKDEALSTRARANMLREIITNEINPFKNKDLYKILDLCLSCKACKSECPSNVDVAKLKAEFLQKYYDKNGVPLRSRLVANITKFNHFMSYIPGISNFFLKTKLFSKPIMNVLGFSTKRTFPELSKKTFRKSYNKLERKDHKSSVYLFVDEFTNYNDADLGIKAISLLDKLGYDVKIPNIKESGRTYLSKGLIRKAKKIAVKNLAVLEGLITEKTPILGIEPSTILTFRDEYIDFFKKGEKLKESALSISKNALLIDEFLAGEIKKGKITKDQFSKEAVKIKLHGHCQQKAITSTEATKFILSFPENYNVEEISSGCCGMAGSFGYEKEHYELSMNIGENVLFPEIRKTHEKEIIAANGTSCRHQIKDGTGRDAVHPVEVLWDALMK